VAQQTTNPPANQTQTPAALHQKKQTQLITILKDDLQYDLIAEIVAHLKMLHRVKKVKPYEKHRMIFNYHSLLLGFCMPKMKIVEDNTDKNARPMNFQINVAGNNPADGKVVKPTTISINTKKNDDGTFVVTK
jgi:hypothetical protein